MQNNSKVIFDRRKFIGRVATGALGLLSSPVMSINGEALLEQEDDYGMNKVGEYKWQIGIAKALITPQNDVWLAGYGRKRVAYGKIHDLWAKVIALKDASGKRVVMVTTDHMGMSKTVYERIFNKIAEQFQLERSQFMLTFSHNHCAPCLEDDLVDYYPSDEQQKKAVKEYTLWMEKVLIAAVDEALHNWQDCELFSGQKSRIYWPKEYHYTEQWIMKCLFWLLKVPEGIIWPCFLGMPVTLPHWISIPGVEITLGLRRLI